MAVGGLRVAERLIERRNLIVQLTQKLFLGADQYQYIIYRKKGNRLIRERFFPRLEQVAHWLANSALKSELGVGGNEAAKATDSITELLKRLTHHVYTLEQALKAAASGITKEVS